MARSAFVSKYGALPGDIPDPQATQLGFIARGTASISGRTGYAQGDGNGLLQGLSAANTMGNGKGLSGEFGGEIAVFWVDLSAAKMIKGSFTTATMSYPGVVASTSYGNYLPMGPLGSYIAIIAGNITNSASTTQLNDFRNYWHLFGTIKVSAAFAIDNKIDDGYPQTGNVVGSIAQFWWIDGGPTDTTTATPPNSLYCYDDGGVTGSKRKYSIASYPQNRNCILTIKFN